MGRCEMCGLIELKPLESDVYPGEFCMHGIIIIGDVCTIGGWWCVC